MFGNESTPQEDFTGFTVDIVKRLKKMLDFDYHFIVLESGGSGNLKNGKWDGLVGALIDQVLIVQNTRP